jgi:hypothetical protein
MAQVESNSEPKLSKGGGGSAKKQQSAQGRPSRQEIDSMIKQLRELSAISDAESLERVLEKTNYDVNNAMNFILEGELVRRNLYFVVCYSNILLFQYPVYSAFSTMEVLVSHVALGNPIPSGESGEWQKVTRNSKPVMI